jgi:hypothetical protein
MNTCLDAKWQYLTVIPYITFVPLRSAISSIAGLPTDKTNLRFQKSMLLGVRQTVSEHVITSHAVLAVYLEMIGAVRVPPHDKIRHAPHKKSGYARLACAKKQDLGHNRGQYCVDNCAELGMGLGLL